MKIVSIIFIIVLTTICYKLDGTIKELYRRQWHKRYETVWKRFMENIINRSYIKHLGVLGNLYVGVKQCFCFSSVVTTFLLVPGGGKKLRLRLSPLPQSTIFFFSFSSYLSTSGLFNTLLRAQVSSPSLYLKTLTNTDRLLYPFPHLNGYRIFPILAYFLDVYEFFRFLFFSIEISSKY